MVIGPEGTFIGGNTEIGLALNMVLPMLIFLRRDESRAWLRHLLLAMSGFTIISILITYSRGAFLGLGVVIPLLFFKSRGKLVAMILLAVAIPVALSTLPEQWFGRMETIQTYEEDSSAMGRINAWKLAYQVALDHPVLGVGFRPFRSEVYEEYAGYRNTTDAHSIFFQVLAEHGFVGLGLYVGLILSTFVSLRQIKRISRLYPSIQWTYNYSEMLEVSLSAYVVSGLFLSMSYFDLYFHLVAIVIVMKKVALAEARQELLATKPSKTLLVPAVLSVK